MPRLPVPCPGCGSPIHPPTTRCKRCHLAALSATVNRCADCGKQIAANVQRCAACWSALRRRTATGRIAPTGRQKVDACVCGREKLARATRCRVCHESGAVGDATTARAYERAGAMLGLPATAETMALWWRDYAPASREACAEALGVSLRWVRAHKPKRPAGRPRAERPAAPPRVPRVPRVPVTPATPRRDTRPAWMRRSDALVAQIRAETDEFSRYLLRLELLRVRYTAWRRARHRAAAAD